MSNVGLYYSMPNVAVKTQKCAAAAYLWCFNKRSVWWLLWFAEVSQWASLRSLAALATWLLHSHHLWL